MQKASLMNTNTAKMKIIMVGDYKVTAIFSNTRNTEISTIIKTTLIDSILNQNKCVNLLKQ